jgi:hypothetical protein
LQDEWIDYNDGLGHLLFHVHRSELVLKLYLHNIVNDYCTWPMYLMAQSVANLDTSDICAGAIGIVTSTPYRIPRECRRKCLLDDCTAVVVIVSRAPSMCEAASGADESLDTTTIQITRRSDAAASSDVRNEGASDDCDAEAVWTWSGPDMLRLRALHGEPSVLSEDVGIYVLTGLDVALFAKHGEHASAYTPSTLDWSAPPDDVCRQACVPFPSGCTLECFIHSDASADVFVWHTLFVCAEERGAECQRFGLTV